MYAGNDRTRTVVLCATFVLPLILLGQQVPANPRKDLTPEREAYREYKTKHNRVQAQARQVSWS